MYTSKFFLAILLCICPPPFVFAVPIDRNYQISSKNTSNSHQSGDRLILQSSSRIVPTVFQPHILVRSSHMVSVYRNGVPLDTVFKEHGSRTIFTPLEMDDVIAFKASNVAGKPGILVELFYKSASHYSGESNIFKARLDYEDSNSFDASTWKTNKFTSCQWKQAETSTIDDNLKKFPFPPTAKYIWAKGAPDASTALIRYVIGGENCNEMSPLPSPSPSPDSTSASNSNDDTCPCRTIPNIKSYCYRMDPSKSVGTCSRILCADKYECVPSGKSLPTCVKAFTEYQVVSIGGQQCERVETKKEPFWVLY